MLSGPEDVRSEYRLYWIPGATRVVNPLEERTAGQYGIGGDAEDLASPGPATASTRSAASPQLLLR